MAFNSSTTSFIPKQALERPGTHAGPRPVGLMFVLALVILFVSGLVLGGALLYRSLLETEIEASCSGGEGVERCGLRATVAREEKNIDTLTTDKMQRLDKKLKIAEQLMKDHNSLLAVFKLVEQNTLPSIR